MNTITNCLHTDRNLVRPTVGHIASDAAADLLEPIIHAALLLSLVGALFASGYSIAAPATPVNDGNVAEVSASPAPACATRSL